MCLGAIPFVPATNTSFASEDVTGVANAARRFGRGGGESGRCSSVRADRPGGDNESCIPGGQSAIRQFRTNITRRTEVKSLLWTLLELLVRVGLSRGVSSKTCRFRTIHKIL